VVQAIRAREAKLLEEEGAATMRVTTHSRRLIAASKVKRVRERRKRVGRRVQRCCTRTGRRLMIRDGTGCECGSAMSSATPASPAIVYVSCQKEVRRCRRSVYDFGLVK
jgi:hypothetical protein